MVNVPIVPQSAPGSLLVTVTKFNHYRYAQAVPVLPPEGPFVVHYRHDVDDDELGGSSGNGDGVINPGETIELDPFWVMNYGVDTAFAVSGRLGLQVADPYVTLMDSTDDYGDIAPDDSDMGTNGYAFGVELTAPNGHNISFYLHCTDGDSVWPSYFSEIVRAPILEYVSNQIDDSGGGNGDGRIDPGETVDMTLTAKNSGGAMASGVTGAMAALSPYIDVTAATASFPNLSPGGQSVSLTDFTISVDPLCPSPSQADLELTLEEDRGLVFVDTFTVRIGMKQVLLVDDDAGDAYESYFTNALDAVGVEYDLWTVSSQGSPGLAVLEEYITVIWTTGEDYTSTLSSSDEANLMAYLNGGGSLYLSSQDYLYDIGSPTTFSTSYLHVSSWTNDVGVDAIAGVAGDPITAGMSFTLSYPFYNWSDQVVAAAGATPIFEITAQKSSAPQRPPKYGMSPDFGTSGPPAPGKTNYCALRYPAEGAAAYQVVFTAIPFESVPTPAGRNLLMEKILDWLHGDEEPPAVAVMAPNGGEFWPVCSHHEISWVATDPSGVDSVTIRLSVDGGNTFPHIITHGKPNLPPYSWIVPPLYSDSAVIKVLAYDSHKNMGWDTSDSMFATADVVPPEAVDDLSIDISSGTKSINGDVYLWWSPAADNWGIDYYVIYRGLSPDLVVDSIAAPIATQYLDVGAVGDTLANYFYLVKAVDQGGNKSSTSNLVGEFDRSLINEAINPREAR
jgi:hypothetical protein